MLERVEALKVGDAGRWRVVTQSSAYIFDFDEGTVERLPGPDATPSINDRPRPIRNIRECRVGKGGWWTMDNDGYNDPNEYYWQMTTPIRSITCED